MAYLLFGNKQSLKTNDQQSRITHYKMIVDRNPAKKIFSLNEMLLNLILSEECQQFDSSNKELIMIACSQSD